MKHAVILAAGVGTKMFPYSLARPKAMLPVANRPVIDYQVSTLLELGVERVFIVAKKEMGGIIRHFYMREPGVQVVDLAATSGTADTLLRMQPFVGGGEFLVLYGDTLLPKAALELLLSAEIPAALVTPLIEPSQNHICCSLSDGYIHRILGHPRGGATHSMHGFIFDPSFFSVLACNSGVFTEIQVGMMPPQEAHLEMSVHDLMATTPVRAVEWTDPGVYDLDKPWHLLSANQHMAQALCGMLPQNEIAEGASICPTALIEGHVRLGKNSRIGRNVIVRGSLIVGDDTVIDSGALLMGDNIIGDRCTVHNGCYLSPRAVVGDDCVVGHAAELDGMIMRRVYLYHYMEIYGVVGENTDIGAATVCGSLRFDDGETIHRVRGRKETPSDHSCAVYIGDYCRTGVNVILAPGVKIGTYSIIGSGTILSGDVPERTLLYPKQEHVIKSWGPEQYGW